MTRIKTRPATPELARKALADADAQLHRSKGLRGAQFESEAHREATLAARRTALAALPPSAPLKRTTSSGAPAELTKLLTPPDLKREPNRAAPEGSKLLLSFDNTIGLPLEFISPLESGGAALGRLQLGIPRFDRLTATERKHESAFAAMVEKDPRAVVDLAFTRAQDPRTGSFVFEVDATKKLYDPYGVGRAPASASEAAVRATANHALHPTATAVTRAAFLSRLDELSKLPTDDPRRSVLVTNGGCAAGKGSLTTLVRQLNNDTFSYGAVWDAAGEQEATENAWVLEAARARELSVTFGFVQNDPLGRYEDVLGRFDGTGRVVDPVTFARSYSRGTENLKAFLSSPEYLSYQAEGRANAVGLYTGRFDLRALKDKSLPEYPELRLLGEGGLIAAEHIEPVPSAADIVNTASAQYDAHLAQRRAANKPVELLETGVKASTAKFGIWGGEL